MGISIDCIMKKWNELSMADRAKYIKLGVEQGITDMNHISSAYNSYAEGGNINKFDNEGKTTLSSFKESLMPIPIDEYIKENYGYRRYKIPEEPREASPIRRNKGAYVGSKENRGNNIPSTKAEPDSVEVSVSKPGTYFPREWKDRPKSTIDSEGNYHTDFPDVYRIDDKPLTFGDYLYRTVTSAIEANPITSSTRVKNMQKADMRNYHDMSPRQTASAMSLIGNFIRPFNAPIGYGMQLFDLGFDGYDAIFNPSVGNTLSVAGDLAGFNKLTNSIKPFNLPALDIPSFTYIDSSGKPVLFPGTTVGGQTVNPVPVINALKTFGVADDIAGSFGFDLLDFKKAEDPDTIRIHQTPQGGYGEYIHTPWEEFNKKKDKK